MMFLPFICLLMFYVCSYHVVTIDTAHIISISFPFDSGLLVQ